MTGETIKSKTLLILFITWALGVQLLFCGNAFPARFESFPSRDAIVLVPPGMEGAAREVLSVFPAVKEEVENFFNWPLNSVTTVMITEGRRLYKERAASNLVVGYAVPNRHLIVIFYSRTRASPANLRVTIKHELCHLMLHEHVKAVRIPRWFDEGISQVVSGVAGEILNLEGDSLMRLARRAGGLIGFRFLTDSFPDRHSALLLAYAESKEFVGYIIRHFGKQGIRAILQAMKEGASIDNALFQVTGLKLHELEARWRKSIEKRDTWLARLSYYLYEILFALAALVSIYIFVRQYRAKKAYHDMDDEDFLGED